MAWTVTPSNASTSRWARRPYPAPMSSTWKSVWSARPTSASRKSISATESSRSRVTSLIALPVEADRTEELVVGQPVEQPEAVDRLEVVGGEKVVGLGVVVAELPDVGVVAPVRRQVDLFGDVVGCPERTARDRLWHRCVPLHQFGEAGAAGDEMVGRLGGQRGRCGDRRIRQWGTHPELFEFGARGQLGAERAKDPVGESEGATGKAHRPAAYDPPSVRWRIDRAGLTGSRPRRKDRRHELRHHRRPSRLLGRGPRPARRSRHGCGPSGDARSRCGSAARPLGRDRRAGLARSPPPGGPRRVGLRPRRARRHPLRARLHRRPRPVPAVGRRVGLARLDRRRRTPPARLGLRRDRRRVRPRRRPPAPRRRGQRLGWARARCRARGCRGRSRGRRRRRVRLGRGRRHHHLGRQPRHVTPGCPGRPRRRSRHDRARRPP